jgi:hypothetical protein
MKTITGKANTAVEARHVSTALVPQGRSYLTSKVGAVLDEIPATVARVRTMLVVMTVTIPVFLAGLLFVLWHLAAR